MTPQDAVRPYKSPLRQAQAEATREKILAAAYAFLEEHDVRDLTMDKLARHAGVAVGTVYKHFPAERELLVAFDAFWRRKFPGMPRAGGGLATMPLERLPLENFPRYRRHRKVIAWQVYSKSWFELRRPVAAEQRAVLVERLRHVAPGLADRELAQAAGAVFVLSAPRVWDWLENYWGLDTPEAAQASAWAITTLLEALRRDPEALRRTPVPPAAEEEHP